MAVRITTGLLRGKGSVAAVPGADTVGSYNSKMISSIPSQATDVGSNIPEGVSSVTLHSRGASVIGRGAILEINARGQPMRIEQTIKCRRKSSHIRRRFGCDDWKSDWGQRGKGCVAAVLVPALLVVTIRKW